MAARKSQPLLTRLADYLSTGKWLGTPALSHAAEGRALIGPSALLENDCTFWPDSTLREIRVVRNPSRLKLL